MSKIKMHTRYALRASAEMPQVYEHFLKTVIENKTGKTYKTRQEALNDRNWRLGGYARDAGAYPEMLEAYEILTFSESFSARVKAGFKTAWAKGGDVSGFGVMAMIGALVLVVVGLPLGIALLVGATPFTLAGLGMFLLFPGLAIGADAIALLSAVVSYTPAKKERIFDATNLFATVGKVNA